MLKKWEPETVMAGVANGDDVPLIEVYRPYLDGCPVAQYHNAAGHELLGVFGYEAVEQVTRNTEDFSNVTVPDGTQRILPLMADPPEHTDYKRLFNSFFRPDEIARVEATVRPLAAELIDGFVSAGSVEFAWDYAYPYSTRTLCELLMVKENWEIYNDWSSKMERLTGSGTNNQDGLPEDHIRVVLPYLAELVEERRAHLGNDAVSRLITTEINGRKLESEEIVGLIIALILAGRSTTASGIANTVLRLARDQELQQYLRKNPEYIPAAIEESLRIEAPQQEMPRRCPHDAELAGVSLAAGTNMFVSYGSANVDPRYWEDPEVFKLDRPNGRRHFAFGRGVHTCPGSPMGRMEMTVTVEELLARTSEFHVDGPVTRNTWPRLSVEQLPLRLTAR